MTRTSQSGREPRPRVVVVGGGFGGLNAALRLARAPVDVTLVDRRNFHLFSPLVYQVATGGLATADIARPLRAIFKRRPNVSVVLGEVTRVDLDGRRIEVHDDFTGHGRWLPYDTLVVAAGSEYSYFGHDEWRANAPALKTLESALDIRRRILAAFEAAAHEPDPEARAAWLTFAVVGGGPTGVELAGQIAEIAREGRREFRGLDTSEARVLLVEAGDRVLGSLHPSLSAKAARQLESLGVTVLTGRTVVGVGERAVTIAAAGGPGADVAARTVVWAAGVVAAPLARVLADAAHVPLDRAGRIAVGPDLALPGHPEVLAIGDMARVHTAGGEAIDLPGTAPVAIQQGRHAARVVRARLRGRPAPAFRYRDKGDMATIGRARAVADLRGLRFGGLLAWVLWLGLHLYYLIGFQNRVVTLVRWAGSFVSRGRGSRLITSPVPQVRSL